MDSPPQVGHVFFSGLNEPCSVDSLVEVVVNTKGGSSGVAPGEVSIFATSPAGLKQKCEVIRRENAFTSTFTPDRIGNWLIGILYEGEHIKGSPFPCQVFDASLVNVYGLDVGLIGQELTFTVDASRAGQGDVQVSVLWNSRSIPASVREEPKGSNVRRVRFTPQGPGQYKVLVTFNSQPVKGSPFLLDIADSSAISVYGEQLRLAAVDRPAEFFVHSPAIYSARQISCSITGPSGKRRMARIVPQEADGTVRVEWKPIEAGEHLIDVLINEKAAYESPFVCQVGDPDLVTVRRMPQFIEARNLHRPHTFEIDATAAGSGNLEIVINGGRVACRVRETSPRNFLAEFTPVHETKHTVEMRFNGEHVRDSPWHIQFSGAVGPASSPALSSDHEEHVARNLAALRRHEQRAAGGALNGRDGVAEEFVNGNGEDIITELVGPGLNRAAVNELAHFSIHSNQRLRSSNVVVRIVECVSGRPVEAQIAERGPGTIHCEYTLPRVADYALEVFLNGRRMDTEPLLISAFDPRRVRVRLKDPEEFRPGKMAQFTVDATEAGKGQLEISVNQGQVPNNVQMQDAGRCLVTFIPQHSGTYVIDVTFNGLQVHGCPIEVDVRERQVGKPVSAPVYARPAGTTAVYGSPPTPRGASVPLERGPSSAYHSSVSPHADTASSYAPSPSSPAYIARAHSQHASPVEQRRHDLSAEPVTTAGDLRSTSLLQSAMRQREKSEPPRGLLGYTVAQYDKTTTTTHTVERRMSPLPPPRETQFGGRIPSPSPKAAVSPPHKYFGTETDVKKPPPPPGADSEAAQFEMTRSAELTLLKEHPSTSEQKEPSSQSVAEFHKAREVPYAPLDQRARRTVEMLRAQQHQQHGLETVGVVTETVTVSPQPTVETVMVDQRRPAAMPTHIVDPFSSTIVDAGGPPPMTPGTRHRLQEHGVHKAHDLKETLPSPVEGRGSATTTDHEAESETPSSRHSSKATTPRLSLKFRGKDKTDGVFEWGKSKLSSKHSVVRRGKEVEVKLDGLKLGKEDVLRVLVTPPATSAASAQIAGEQRVAEPTAAQPQAVEIVHRLRKTGSKTWEISFKPTEVGTHKVLVFVNNMPHPQTPFPIRVYDAGQIVVEDIVTEATVNDTVEFTVDAGRAGFGNLEMAIKDHDGIIIPSHVSQIESGTAKFLVTFNPATAGTHTVHITFNKEVVRGSPFEVHILEPSQTDEAAMISGKKKKDKKANKNVMNGAHPKSPTRETEYAPGKMEVSEPPSLSRVDRPIELSVTVTNPDAVVQAQAYEVNSRETVPVQIHQDGPTTRRIVFTPRRVGDHEVRLQLNDTEVDESPLICRVYDPAKILVGPIPDGGVDLPVKFVVDASQAGVGNLEVAVNEGKIPSTASGLGHHKYQITFVPKEPIDHTISVHFNNEPVPGSPFTCHLLVPEKVLQQKLLPQQQQQPQQIRHAPQSFSVIASGPGLERTPVGQLTEFIVDVLPSDEGDDTASAPVIEQLPKVQITDPRGDLLPVDVAAYEEEPSRSVVRYTPQTVGNHQISVQFDGQSVPGSPFTVKAFDAECVKLTLDQPAKVGRSCTFTIDAAKAGAGNMEIIVSVGKRNVPNYVQAEGQARFKVSFTPQEAQEHQISVKFNGIPVPGSPLRCAVAPAASSHRDEAVPVAQPAEEKERQAEEMVAEEEELRLVGDMTSARLGEPKRFSIDVPPHNGRVECNVVVVDPQGSPLPVRCYKQQDDSYWVEFTPEICGAHSIEVMFGDQPVPGSPFHCEVVDPRRVQVHGADRPFTIRTMANFVVSRKGAGTGPLAVELTDPQNEPIKLDRVLNSSGDESFTFVPTRLGPHKLALKLAGFAVHGSPFSLVVEEQKEPCVYGAALDYAIERGQQASMIFDPNNHSGGLKVDVHDPSGAKVKHNTNRRPDDSTEISFRPHEVGIYTVDVQFNNRTVQGSPFSVLVVDPSKVLVNNERLRPVDGLLQLDAGQRNVLDVDATGAGPVKLRAEVRDGDGELLGGAERGAAPIIELNSLGNSKHQLLFTPPRAGKYKLYLYCSELVVPSAYPLLAIAEKIGQTAAEERDELSKVVLRGEGLTTARVKESAEFIIDASEMHDQVGKINAALLGERADIPVKVSALRNQVYKGIYTPLMGGTYQLIVQIDSKNVPGSPSTVQVHSHQLPAELISVDAKPLKFGVINEDIRTIIDARKATAGHLSAQCSGPTRPEYCELMDNRDGTYVLRVQPKELGRHTLTIKYDNENVPGSPFTFNVTNPPDPSRVKVYGPGIEHGILHTFKSNFVVDTKGAGAGQLTVRVRGPKGAFNVEMQRDSAQERTIHCKYEPREPGDYQVEVKWHGHHVPGSPFFVLIVDTEQELQRFLAGGVPSPTPPSPFVPPGWMAPPPPPPGVLPLPPIMPSPPPHFRGAPHMKQMQMLPPPSPAHQHAIYGGRHHY